MFKVGDVVTCVRKTIYSEKLRLGQVCIVTHVLGNGNVRVDGDIETWGHDRFVLKPVPMRPAEGVAVVRLRVIEGMRPHLRVGDIVTVKKENEKSYLLNEHPGKLWAKRRFEHVQEEPVRAPKKAPRPLKVGDSVICITEIPNPLEGIGYVPDMQDAYETHEVVSVIVESRKIHSYKEGHVFNGRLEGRESWCWPLKHFVFEDLSPIEGGASLEEIEAYKNKNKIVAKSVKEQAISPKPALGCIYEEAAKLEKAGTIGKDLCSWVVQNKGADKYQHQNWPCYADLQGDAHSKVEQCLISMKNAKRYLHTVKEQEMYDDWLKYVVEESPFKSAFLTKTAEEAKEKGLLLDCSRPRVECLTSATAMRDGYEHSQRLPIFTHFIEEGYSKHTAYLLSYMLTEHDGSWNMSSMNNGHTNMDGGQDIQQIFKFFREGYHNDFWKAQPAWNSGKKGNGGMYVYIAEASKDSMRAFVQSFGKKSGQGWQERYSFDEKCVKKLADAIEANIVK